MRRVLSCILCLITILTMGNTVCAANPTSGSTTITTTVEAKYTVAIPANTTIAYGSTSTPIGNINVSSLQLLAGQQLVISANHSGNLRNSADSSEVIPYTLKCEGVAFNNVVFTSTGSKSLSVDITSTSWNMAAAGSYSDTITFSFASTTIP